MSKGYEAATSDKNLQEEKIVEMEDRLHITANFRKILYKEHERYRMIIGTSAGFYALYSRQC